MTKINKNYLELQGSYLFSTIAKKVKTFTEAKSLTAGARHEELLKKAA